MKDIIEDLLIGKFDKRIVSYDLLCQIYDMSWHDFESILGYKIARRKFLLAINFVNDLLLEMEWKSFISEKPKVNLFEAFDENRRNFRLISKNVRKIRTSIKNRHFAKVRYVDADGNEGFRLIEPYVLGRGYVFGGLENKNHKLDRYIRCFVVRDGDRDKTVKFSSPESISISEHVPYWRIFRVDRILEWTTIYRKFSYYRPEYTGGTDKNFSNILAHVPLSDFKGENIF